MPLEYGPDRLTNYEVGIKSQWLDNRLQLNVSAFLMKWDDIQVHFSSTSDADNGAFWVEGNINGGKAEQKGVEFNGSGTRPSAQLRVERIPREPEFTEDTFVPNTIEVYIAKGTTMPVSPKEKYWAAVEYTFPDFLPLQGDFWTRFSYSWQGKIWDSLTAIDGQRPRVPDSRMEVRHVPGWLHQRQRLGCGAHRAQRLRRRRPHLAEQHHRRRVLRRSALALRAQPAAAANYTLSFTKKW